MLRSKPCFPALLAPPDACRSPADSLHQNVQAVQERILIGQQLGRRAGIQKQNRQSHEHSVVPRRYFLKSLGQHNASPTRSRSHSLKLQAASKVDLPWASTKPCHAKAIPYQPTAHIRAQALTPDSKVVHSANPQLCSAGPASCTVTANAGKPRRARRAPFPAFGGAQSGNDFETKLNCVNILPHFGTLGRGHHNATQRAKNGLRIKLLPTHRNS